MLLSLDLADSKQKMKRVAYSVKSLVKPSIIRIKWDK